VTLRTEKITALVVLGLCLLVLAGGIVMWISEPPRAVPGPEPVGVPTPHGTPNMDGARGLCALIGRPQGLDPAIVNAAVTSGELPYALASAAARYAAEASEGTKLQVLGVCRELGLTT
jgi:hypothetical protein